MAGGRRNHKRPRYPPPPVQPLPLAPGANRFQPSEAYLARLGQQSLPNLAPATAPAFWPPTPAADQLTGPAQPSAAARWVEEQERVHETTGFAPPPSAPPSASGDVEHRPESVPNLCPSSTMKSTMSCMTSFTAMAQDIAQEMGKRRLARKILNRSFLHAFHPPPTQQSFIPSTKPRRARLPSILHWNPATNDHQSTTLLSSLPRTTIRTLPTSQRRS
ncbi:hypothetical protein BCR35DRAFT_77068 [Leucosporidium creatinivorum]|uniref:Uncharacterized protein n=1 Tax=Leucosporidium creatinivorum TaxID=106004 RepID=A0A1Y2G4T8_9BASI|nr:hypothetical protein BCR35DRAFT_77068 [Leucosporidium creatinivorum]